MTTNNSTNNSTNTTIWCRYHTGMLLNQQCAAGIVYADLPRPLPCHHDSPNYGQCPLFAELTPAELAERARRVQELWQRYQQQKGEAQR